MKRAIFLALWILFFLFVVIFVVSAALPTWISTPQGKNTVLKWINSRIEGKLSIDAIELNWWGKQHIEGLCWVDEQGKVLYQVRLLDTQTSLLYLLFGGRTPGRTVIEDPFLRLSDTRSTKSSSALSSKKKQSHFTKSYPQFLDTLDVRNGTLILESQQFSPITISQINIHKTEGIDTFHIEAQTQQGATSGSICIDAQFRQKFQAKVKIQQFPIALLDELEGSAFFTEALGPALSLDMDVQKEKNASLTIHGSASSANLTAYIDGVTENKTFKLSSDTQLDFYLTPTLFKWLIDEEQRKDWELASKTRLKIQIEKGIFPLTLKKPDFKDITLQASVWIDRAELHHQTLGSYSLKQFQGSIFALNNLEITYAGEIQGKELTKLSGTTSVTPKGEVLFQYTYQGFPVTLLSLISSDLEKQVRFLFGGQFDMESEGTFINHQLETKVVIESPTTHLKANIQGPLDKLYFDILGTTHVPPAKAQVLGNFFDFNFTGYALIQDQQFSIPKIKGNVYNPYLSFDLRGEIGQEGKPLSPEAIQLIATGKIHHLPMLEEHSPLENTIAYIQIDGSKNLVIIKGDGSGLDATIEIHDFIHQQQIAFDQANITFNAQLQSFPLKVINPFISNNLDLATLFGPTLNLTTQGTYTPYKEPQFIINLDASSSGFTAALALAIDGTLAVKQNQPSRIYWEITPERYQVLMQTLRLDPETKPTFILTRPTQLELNITQFICPTTSPQDLGHFLCQSGFVGDIRLGTTTFRSKSTDETLIFQSISGAIKGENFSEGIDLNLKGAILAANVPQSEKSAFAFEGKMLHFWTKEGHFNREGLTVTGELSLDLLPVRQITGIVPMDQQTRANVQAILGEFVNARIYGEISQLSGPLTVDIKASNFKAKLPLVLHKNAVYLSDYVDAEITLTDAVNATLLKDINPLFIAGVNSEHPLKLYIDPHDFVLPLRPYSLQGVKIGKAILDIGKINVRNGGQVQSLMDFLQAKEISHDGWMEAWFTPIFINLQNGVASYKRFDALLAGNIHIALWGSIHLLNEKVNMTLAIAPTTLYQRFKIAGLKKQDMFQVKMRGTTGNLELDWSSAYTRIAFIVARTASGHLGSLIGGLLEQLVTAFGEEPAPPSTTTPLPWESQYPSEPGQSIPQEASSHKKRGVRSFTEFLTN